MANLSSKFLGIKSPNPFWLASAPPTDKAYNVERAFKAGWGGAVVRFRRLGVVSRQRYDLIFQP
jgi:dihydroorotate dehydrogenase